MNKKIKEAQLSKRDEVDSLNVLATMEEERNMVKKDDVDWTLDLDQKIQDARLEDEIDDIIWEMLLIRIEE